MNATKREFNIAGAISSDKRLSELVQAAHQMLGDIVESPWIEVKEDWSLSKDAKDRPVAVLNLSDDIDSRGEAKFVPEDLEDRRELGWSLRDAWNDLLRDRSNKLLKRLLDPEDTEDHANGS